VAIEYRWAEGRFDRLPALAADLVGHNVDVIVTSGGPIPARAANNATATIPIAAVVGGDPVADGLIASLARPGGNLTGVTFTMTEQTPKRFELLSELVPHATVIALLVNPNDAPSAEHTIRDLQEAAHTHSADRSEWFRRRCHRAFRCHGVTTGTFGAAGGRSIIGWGRLPRPGCAVFGARTKISN